MQKLWVRVVAAVAALLVLAIILVPLFVNADTFRPTLEGQLSAALGRKVTLGHLTFSLLAGSLVAEDIAIADDPTFSSVPFLQAKKFDIGVEILPFLFHHQVRITKLVIDTPSIQLIQHNNGKWNFGSIGGSSAQPSSSSQQPPTVLDLTVGELKISNGSATVSSIPETARPFVYSDLNLTVKQFSFLKSFPFDLSAELPGNGSLKLTGSAGPVAQKDASATPFQATIQLKEFDPVAAGVVDTSKGISMVNDVDAQLSSDGTTVSSKGKIKSARLQLARNGSPARQTVDIDYAISDNLNTRIGRISDLAIHTGSVAVLVAGGFRFTPQAILLDLHLSAPNLPIDQLEQLLPVVGIRLPSGSSLHGGTLTATMTVSGPATASTITGPVEIDNTKLAGFDLGSKIQGLNPFGGTSGGTDIQTLRAAINSSPQSTQITNIYGSVPAIGTATGSGTVSPSGALNFNMVAKLNTSSGVGAVANQAAGSIGGFFGKVLHSAVNNGVPLTITGTASNPSIRANVAGMLR